MSYGISTRRDAEIQLLEALEMSSWEIADKVWDLDAILEACHEATSTWNLTHLEDDDEFWQIVMDNVKM